MKERPILFSAPMVRALLAGTKTVTRRIVNLRQFGVTDTKGYDWTFRCKRGLWQDYRNVDFLASKYAKCRVGDRLWVRETHAQFAVGEGVDTPVPQNVAYRATCDSDGGFDYVNGRGEPMRLKVTKWTPAIFMPRWASRIALDVVSVRVERLHDITEDDAAREGVERDTEPCDHTRLSCDDIGCMGPTHRSSFAELWMTINGEESWAENPWVWRVEFKRIADEQRQVAA